MGQTTDQIENYIENKREDLGSNLHELESKIQSMTDWKQHFQKNPMTMLGVAFGGGILVAAMLGGRHKGRRSFVNADSGISRTASSEGAHLKDAAMETWDHIKGALVGVAATRAKDFIEDVVPGFRDHFERAKRSNGYTAP